MYAVAKFCVLCLQRGQKLINIVVNDDSDGVVVKQKLLYLLYEVLNLQPEVPKYICEHCLKEINRFYKFKRKCLDNLVILQTYLEQLSDSKRSYQNLSVRLEDYIKPQIKCELNLKTEFTPEIQIEDLESLHETKDDITFSDENEINEDQQNDAEETVEDLHEEDESDEQSDEEETVEDTQSTPDNRKEVMKMIGYVPSLSIYECKICSYRSSFYNVKMHALRSHQNHVAHSCSKCGRNFSRLSELEWHQTGNSYCVTQKDLMQESKILAHMSEADLKAGPIFGEEVKKNLKCRVCSAKFRRYCNLKVHIMRKHSTYRPFICSKCNRGFAVLCELQNHESGNCLGPAKPEIRLVIDKKIRAFLKETTDASEDCTQSGDDSKWPNKCNICSIEFTKVFHFKTHILRKHLKYKPYHCSKCDRRFYFQSELRQHEAKKFCPPVKQIRNVPHHKRHKCTICSCSYIKKWNLKLHMIQVHSYRPHFCPKCGRGFVHKHELSAHMSRKTCRTAQLDNKSSVIDRKKKFKCSLCYRLFARKFNLDIHKRVRHGVGSLHCNKCSRSFPDRDLLIEHKKSEHKSVQEYSYECNTCKEKLRTFNAFKQHLERSSHKSPSCKLCSFSSDNLETFRKHMVFSHDKLIKTFCAKLTTNENMNTLTSGEEETNVVEKQMVPVDGETSQNDSLLPVKDNEIDIIKNEPTSLKLLDKDILNEIQEMKSQESKVTNEESVELPSINGPEIEEIQYFKTPAEGGRKYKCSRCNYCFAELCGLKKHVANSNDKSKPLQCPYCCRRFTSKSFLIKHKLGHFRKKNENRCTICSKVYPSIIELNKHLHENHLEKKQNECEASAKIIIQEAPQGTAINCQHCEFQGEASSMENHLKTHHSYKCEKCDSVFRVKAQLIKHYQTVHTDLSSKFFQCPHCSKLFSIKTNLKRHILIHTGASKPFSCDSCDKSFPDKARLQEHMLKHVGIPLFSCSICKYSAWTQKKLKMHQFDYHKPDFTRIECSPQIEDNSEKINIGVRVHCEKCTFCERSFADNESLKRHIMTHIQNVGKTNKCEVCGIEFAEKEALSLHIKSHSVENLFACAYCPETFAKSRELYRHTIQAHLENTINPIELQNNILVINNDDPSEDGSYKCPICAKLFQSKSNFWRHLLTHAKEKPFKCKFCEHRCNDPGYLEIHMRKHTGEKPYTCLYCPRTFSTSSYLRRHERDVHKIDIASKKTDTSILKCQVCNKRFSKTNYVSHMQSHQKDPPPWNFSCCFCQKSFMDIKTLQNHLIADHQGEVTNNPQTQTSQPIEIVEATPSVSSVVKTEPLGDLTIKVEVQDYEEFILPDQFGA